MRDVQYDQFGKEIITMYVKFVNPQLVSLAKRFLDASQFYDVTPIVPITNILHRIPKMEKWLEVPDNEKTAGADRGPHGQLARPRRCSSQEQVGDIRAGDQQHERHQHEQNV